MTEYHPIRRFRNNAVRAATLPTVCTMPGASPRTGDAGRQPAATTENHRLFRPASLMLCLLLVLLQTVPLRAQDFQRFSVQIPFGWEVTEKPANMLIIRSPDGDASAVIICAALPDKRPARDVLEDYVRYFSGSEPQQRNANCRFFHFTHNGTRHTALFVGNAQDYLLLIVSDPRNRYPECLAMLMDSLVLHKGNGAALP